MSILQQSSTLTIVSVPFPRSVLWCDSSTGILRPLIPETMRRLVFKTNHSVSYPGKRASRRLISRCFVWEFLSRDINLWARSCLDCQCSKVQSHNKSPVHHIPVPGRRFTHIHVDLVSLMASLTSSPSLTGLLDGQRQFPSSL